jgi:hypothetical protein
VARMTLSSPALAGALGGLAVGLVEYVTALRVIGRVLDREGAAGGDMPGLSALAGRMLVIRRGLAAVSFVLLPALGFALGAAFGAVPESSP